MEDDLGLSRGERTPSPSPRPSASDQRTLQFTHSALKSPWKPIASPQLLWLPREATHESPLLIQKPRGVNTHSGAVHNLQNRLEQVPPSSQAAAVAPEIWGNNQLTSNNNSQNGTSSVVLPLWSSPTPDGSSFRAIFGQGLLSGRPSKQPRVSPYSSAATAGIARLPPYHAGPTFLPNPSSTTPAVTPGIATSSSTKFRGVYRLSNGMWRARFTLFGISVELGTFAVEEDAARCIDKVAVQIHGSADCPTNFSVHPATAAGWLDEKLPRQIEELLEEEHTLPNASENRKEGSSKLGGKRSRAGAARISEGPSRGVLGASAAGHELDFDLEKRGVAAGTTATTPASARPAHRRRKKTGRDEDWCYLSSDGMGFDGLSSASEGNSHGHGAAGTAAAGGKSGLGKKVHWL